MTILFTLNPIFSPVGGSTTEWECTYTLSQSAILSNSGEYFCRADIDGGSEDSNTVDLTVFGKFSLH